MSATIVSFAQFQESRQRRHPAGPIPNVQPLAIPESDSPEDQPLTITCDVPAPAPRDPALLPQRP
jgi:hypothetical protein